MEISRFFTICITLDGPIGAVLAAAAHSSSQQLAVHTGAAQHPHRFRGFEPCC